MPNHFAPIPRCGAPLGNNNPFKHGFYTRRMKRNLSSEESTNLKSLVDEIALIRVFTHKLVESSFPSADLKDWQIYRASSVLPPPLSPVSSVSMTSSQVVKPVSTPILKIPSARSTLGSPPKILAFRYPALHKMMAITRFPTLLTLKMVFECSLNIRSIQIFLCLPSIKKHSILFVISPNELALALSTGCLKKDYFVAQNTPRNDKKFTNESPPFLRP